MRLYPEAWRVAVGRYDFESGIRSVLSGNESEYRRIVFCHVVPASRLNAPRFPRVKAGESFLFEAAAHSVCGVEINY